MRGMAGGAGLLSISLRNPQEVYNITIDTEFHNYLESWK